MPLRYKMAVTALAMLLAFVALMAIPAPEVPEESTEAELESNDWQTFRGKGAAFRGPRGFAIHDPLDQEMTPSPRRWLTGAPSRKSRCVWLDSEAGEFQIFMLLGQSTDLDPLLAAADQRFAGRPEFANAEPIEVTTHDGHTIHCLEMQLPGEAVENSGAGGVDEGAAPGEVLFLGRATLGERTFIIDAGGLAGDYSRRRILELMSTLRLGK